MNFKKVKITTTAPHKDAEKIRQALGEANKLETVEEEQIEVICERDKAKQVIAALRKAHPYEEPIVDIVPLLDEDTL